MRSKVCMAPIHVQSTVCIAPFHVRSKVCKFASHMDGSRADFAPHMEGSHADFPKQFFQTIYTIWVYMTYVTTFDSKIFWGRVPLKLGLLNVRFSGIWIPEQSCVLLHGVYGKLLRNSISVSFVTDHNSGWYIKHLTRKNVMIRAAEIPCGFVK